MTKYSDLVLRGTYSAIPTAGIAGRQYFATDTAKFYRDNGSTWDEVSAADTGAIHKATAAEISGLTEKTTPAGNDLLVIEDSADSNNKKKLKISNLPTGAAGNTTSTNTYANRPAAATSGNLFLPSDGAVIERDTGAAWVPWGPMWSLTKANAGDFAWINQGSATAVETNGSIYISCAADSNNSVKLIKKAAPATPYTVTALMIPSIVPSNYQGVGIGFRESGTGKLVTLSYIYSGAFLVAVTNYTNATTYSSDPASLALGGPLDYIWLQLYADGTNLVYQYGVDGYNFRQIYTSVKAAWFTTAPDEVFMFTKPQNSTYWAGAFFPSFKVA